MERAEEKDLGGCAVLRRSSTGRIRLVERLGADLADGAGDQHDGLRAATSLLEYGGEQSAERKCGHACAVGAVHAAGNLRRSEEK